MKKSALSRIIEGAAPRRREYDLNGVKVYVPAIPVDAISRAERVASIQAARELAANKDYLRAQPIDESKWEETLRANGENANLLHKPANLYDQVLTSRRQEILIVELSAEILIDEDGNRVAQTPEELGQLKEIVRSELGLIQLVAEAIQDMGNSLNPQPSKNSVKK